MPEAVLLDTSALIDLRQLDMARCGDDPVVLSAVTIGEIAFGVDKKPAESEAREALMKVALSRYEVLPFGAEEAKIYGVLAGLIRAIGRNPRPRRLDLQIAATAAAARIPLLTFNPDDFRGLSLMVEVIAAERTS